MTGIALPSKRSLVRRIIPYWQVYLLLLPMAVWFLVFCYAPMGGLVIAFKKYSVLKGIAQSPWVGMDNFVRLFGMPAFQRAVGNTLIISLQKLIFGFPIPILFAILLNELRLPKLQKLTQTVSYLPHFISWSVTGGLVYMLLSPSTGVIQHIVTLFGGQAQNYIGKSEYFRPIVFWSYIWNSMGWSAIIYIAAITSVDEQLYEAARIDGAGRFARIWHVTLPGIRAIISIQLILAVGNILNISFDQIFILVNDATLDVGETIDYFIYRVGLYSANNFSLATASGMVKSLIGFALVISTNALCKRLTDGEEGIW